MPRASHVTRGKKGSGSDQSPSYCQSLSWFLYSLMAISLSVRSEKNYSLIPAFSIVDILL